MVIPAATGYVERRALGSGEDERSSHYSDAAYTHRLLALEDSSATSLSLPLAETTSRVRLDGEEEEACWASSFSFCFALTLALERRILTSAGAVGVDVDDCSMFEADGLLLDVASVCWVKSI